MMLPSTWMAAKLFRYVGLLIQKKNVELLAILLGQGALRPDLVRESVTAVTPSYLMSNILAILREAGYLAN
ncbi:hypothetical protein OUZ56_002388 [Daphnia magna]|uniref:Uncharacterized protein n=1 Tax=Daphnia magna TaxID=35525 RepID=A0ABR0A5I5_9CRUS|nr:hypothetical protein OUZ56_002388 [Daphnia magna]